MIWIDSKVCNMICTIWIDSGTAKGTVHVHYSEKCKI